MVDTGRCFHFLACWLTLCPQLQPCGRGIPPSRLCRGPGTLCFWLLLLIWVVAFLVHLNVLTALLSFLLLLLS